MNAIEEIEATKLHDGLVKDDLELQMNAKSNGNLHVTTRKEKQLEN